MLTPDQLQKLTEEVAKSVKLQNAAWEQVIRDARAYAMLEAFGAYIDHNGHRVSVHHSNIPGRLDFMRIRLMDSIKQAYQDEAITGSLLT